MKYILAVFLATASGVVSNADIFDLTSTITFGPDVTGSASGTYDSASGYYSITGSLHSPSSSIPLVGMLFSVEQSGTSHVDVGLISYNDGKDLNFSGSFGVNSTPPSLPYPSAWPSGFSANFSHFIGGLTPSITLLGSAPLVVTPASTPEPQTYALAAGAALLGFAAFRRARR